MGGCCVLITGTIVPNVSLHGREGQTAAKRAEYENVASRRARYLENLRWYASKLELPIYFLENSVYDFESDGEIQDLFGGEQLHLMRLPVSAAADRGKGYQEFEMIDEAVLRLAGTHEAFVKVSGRYLFRNVQHLFPKRLPGIAIDLLRRPRVAITSVFACRFDFYRAHLAGAYREADDARGWWIERELYSRLSGAALRSEARPLLVEPKLISDVGWDGSGRAGWAPGAKRAVRNFERRLLRGIGYNEIV